MLLEIALKFPILKGDRCMAAKHHHTRVASCMYDKIIHRVASIPSQDPEKRHLAPAWLKVEQRDAFSIGFRVLRSALGHRHLRP